MDLDLGGARGLDPVESGSISDWQWMYDVNVLGTVRVTQAFLPALDASGAGTVVVMSSTAGLIVYEGGGGYAAAKHAQTAIAETLRLELSGRPIRVIEIDPGMVRTEEFGLTRFDGDAQKADAVYAELSRHGGGAVQEVDSACVQMDSLSIRGRPDAAVTLGLDLLSQLGVRVPCGDLWKPVAQWSGEQGRLALRRQAGAQLRLAFRRLLFEPGQGLRRRRRQRPKREAGGQRAADVAAREPRRVALAGNPDRQIAPGGHLAGL